MLNMDVSLFAAQPHQADENIQGKDERENALSENEYIRRLKYCDRKRNAYRTIGNRNNDKYIPGAIEFSYQVLGEKRL